MKNKDAPQNINVVKSQLIVKEDEESAALTKAELEKADPELEKANAILSGQNKKDSSQE